MKRLLIALLLVFPMIVLCADPAVITEPTNSEKIVQWWTIAITVLFGVSEALAAIPAIKSNAVYQLIFNILKALSGKDKK